MNFGLKVLSISLEKQEFKMGYRMYLFIFILVLYGSVSSNKIYADIESITVNHFNLTRNLNAIIPKNNIDHIKQLKFRDCWMPYIPQGIFTKIRYLEHADFSACDLATLSRYNFSGAFNLRELNLSHNELSNLQSHVFDGANNLVKINLAHNKIATVDSKTLSHLAKLIELDLSHNELSSLPENLFFYLSHIKIINLSNNFIKTIDDWAEFTNLQYLNLNFNQILNASFSDDTQIQNISLNNNQLEYLVINNFVYELRADSNHLNNKKFVFNDCNNLIKLSLANNSLSSFDFIRNFTNLSYLNLSYNPLNFTNDENEIDIFSNLQNLKNLILKSVNLNQFNFKPFTDLPKLESLDISYNGLSSINFEYLGFLENLRYLNINDNNLENLTFEELNYLLPKLNSISISNNSWRCDNLKLVLNRFIQRNIVIVVDEVELIKTDVNIRGIQCNNVIQNIPTNDDSSLVLRDFNLTLPKNKQEHIKQFFLINCWMPYIPDGIFTQIPYLEQADFSACHIATLSRYNFSDASNLRKLNLIHNELSDLPGHVFDGATNLEEINLSHNKIVTIDSHSFIYLVKLTELYLSHNKLGSLPSNLFINKTHIKIIDLSNNLIKTIDDWAEFSNLQYLNLNFNCIDNATFSDHTKIQNISLNNNQLEYLVINNFVYELHADNNYLNNKNLVFNDCNRLIKLSLANNSLSSLDFIRNFTNFSYLNLSYNPFNFTNDEHEIDIFLNLQNLKILILKSVNLNQFNFKPFTDLRKLESLDISYNGLSSINFEYIGFLENLRYLNINDNNLENLTFEELNYLLPKLNSISISNNSWRCDDLKLVLNRFIQRNIAVVIDATEIIKTEVNIRGIGCRNNTIQNNMLSVGISDLKLNDDSKLKDDSELNEILAEIASLKLDFYKDNKIKMTIRKNLGFTIIMLSIFAFIGILCIRHLNEQHKSGRLIKVIAYRTQYSKIRYIKKHQRRKFKRSIENCIV